MTPAVRMKLTLAEYASAGGLESAIDQDAERVFHRFPDERGAITRLFQRITEKGEGEKPIRRPETLAVLAVVTGLDSARLRVIVDAFGERGLLVLRPVESGEIQADLPHECLEWKWGRLKGWIDEEAVRAKSLQFLKESAEKKQWLTGSALSEALQFREQGRLDGLWPLRYLAETDLAAVARWLVESEKRDQAERNRLDRERRRARWTAFAASLMALTLAVLAGWALKQKGRADRFAVQARKNLEQALENSKTANAAEALAKDASANAWKQLSITNQEKHNAQVALAQSAVQDGVNLLEQGRPDEAAAYFARALRSDPDSAAAVSWISDLLLNGFWWLRVAALQEARAYSAVFSLDGHRVVTLSDDNTAQVWDADTGKRIGPALQHKNTINSAVFSPDGRRVLTASFDHTAQVWDADTGRRMGAPLQHQDLVFSGAFSADGRRVVTASFDNTAQVWEADTGERVGGPLQHKTFVSSAAFSPDGRRVVTLSFDQTQVWDIDTGKPVGTQQHGPLEEVIPPAFSPDGRSVMTAYDDHTVQVWNAELNKLVGAPLQNLDKITLAAFSPDGGRVVTASRDGTAQVWEAGTGSRVGAPLQHGNWVYSAAFSRDGQRVITTCGDGTARVWEAESGRPIATATLRYKSVVPSGILSAGGRRVLVASGSQTAPLEVWEVGDERPAGEPRRYEHAVSRGAPSFPRSRVATASSDNTLQIWDAETGQRVGTSLHINAEVKSAAFSPDGRRLVTAFANGAQVWEVDAGRRVGAPLAKGGIYFLSFSPDGHRVVTVSDDYTVQVWDADTGRRIGPALQHKDTVHSVVFSPDGRRVVTASSDHTAQVLEADTGRRMGAPLEHKAEVTSASFSSDGRRVLTASWDGTTRVWDAGTGNPVGPPMRPAEHFVDASFSPDGSRLVTVADNTAQVWEAGTSKPVGAPMQLQAGVGVRSAEFSPDGRRVVIAAWDNTVRLWEADTGKPVGSPMQLQLPRDQWLYSAWFASDGRHVVTDSSDGTLRVWSALLSCCASQQEADRLAALAEAVGGYEVSDTGSLVLIAPDERQARLNQLARTSVATRPLDLSLDWIVCRFAPAKFVPTP